MFFGDFFDLDAALRGTNDRYPGLRAIEHHGKIQFAGDIEPFLDQYPAHPPAFRPGLMGHKILAEHLARSRRGFIRSLDDLNPAAFAAAAGMNLRFDHAYPAAKFLRRLPGLSGVDATILRGTTTPKRLRISLAWNS